MSHSIRTPHTHPSLERPPLGILPRPQPLEAASTSPALRGDLSRKRERERTSNRRPHRSPASSWFRRRLAQSCIDRFFGVRHEHRAALAAHFRCDPGHVRSRRSRPLRSSSPCSWISGRPGAGRARRWVRSRKVVAEYNGAIKLAKVDCDKEQALAAMFGVRSIPTVVLVRDGQLVDGFSGALPEATLREFLSRHVQPGEVPGRGARRCR